MTYYEEKKWEPEHKQEEQEKESGEVREDQASPAEHKVEPKNHLQSYTYSNHNKESNHNREESIIKIKLNGFQKFLAVAVIIQIILLLFIAVKLPDSGAAEQRDNLADNVPTRAPAPAPSAPSAVASNAELIDDDAVKGEEDAPVTIVEFSDYECPFCVRFYKETYGQLKAKYIDTGKVKFVYRDFPLSFHQNAQKAAEAAECAGEQDKYYEMHNKLFEDGVAGGVTAFKGYAQELGLDTNEFNTCLDSGKMASEVKKDFDDGAKFGVSGTPAFFINGKLLTGAQPLQAFEQMIEQELS